MQYVTVKEVQEIKDVSIFHYALNVHATKMFEFGSIFLLIIGTLIYPTTHFEPRQWMAVSIVLAIAAIVTFVVAQYWRKFAAREFIAWDAENFYVSQGKKGVAVVPWNAMSLENTGLKDPTAGSVLNIQLSPNDPIVKLRLVSGFIIVVQFQNVLSTILTHIKENVERAKQDKG